MGCLLQNVLVNIRQTAGIEATEACQLASNISGRFQQQGPTPVQTGLSAMDEGDQSGLEPSPAILANPSPGFGHSDSAILALEHSDD